MASTVEIGSERLWTLISGHIPGHGTKILTLLLELRGGRLADDGPHGPQAAQKTLEEASLSAVPVPNIHAVAVVVSGGDWGRAGRGGGGAGGGIRLLRQADLIHVMFEPEHAAKDNDGSYNMDSHKIVSDSYSTVSNSYNRLNRCSVLTCF